MARPTVMTEAVIAKLEEAFAWGCTDIEACLHADIAIQTLYKYQEREPKFLDRKNALKENPILLARKSVVNNLSKDSKLAMDFLSRKKKDEFSQKSEQNISGTLDLNLKDKTDEELDEIINGYKADGGGSSTGKK